MEVKHYSIFSNTVYWIKYFWKKDHAIIWMSMMQIVLSSIALVIGIYLPKITIDLLIEGATTYRFIGTLGLIAVFMLLIYCLRDGLGQGKYWIYSDKRVHAMSELFLKSLRVRYDITESGQGKTAYQKALNVSASGDWSASSMTLTSTITIFINVISFVLYSTVLSMLNVWMIVILIVLSMVNCVWISMNLKYRESVREEEAYIDRRFYYIKSVMGDTTAAKDVRIFGMNHWLTGLRDKTIEDGKRLHGKIQNRNAWQERTTYLTTMVRDLLAYGYLIYMATEGNVTLGEFVLYFGAITGFSTFVSSIVSDVGELRGARNATDYFRAYMAVPDEDLLTGDKHIGDLTMPLSIEFKDICFTYKSTSDEAEKIVFNHFNLKIEAGERIALVGVNGAGKTTLVKLLCGMYAPDSGQILINGIDQSCFPKGELYDLFSVVFQEQLVMPFSLGENIAMTPPENMDQKKAWEAIEKAGMKKVLEEKNIDLDTFMTKQILRSGVSFSGGQQQRLLLARALYKDGPIMILDEPTAALDPIAESEIYESYNKFTENKTAIFISHRLASTRFSDRIVMIENGKILEMGTHEELMARDGAYANMYQIQSSYYSEKGSYDNGDRFNE